MYLNSYLFLKISQNPAKWPVLNRKLINLQKMKIKGKLKGNKGELKENKGKLKEKKGKLMENKRKWMGNKGKLKGNKGELKGNLQKFLIFFENGLVRPPNWKR